MLRPWAVLPLLLFAACLRDVAVRFDDVGAKDAAQARGDAGVPVDAGLPLDGGAALDARVPVDAGVPDALAPDATSADALPADAELPEAGPSLDPDLALPDPKGAACTYPGDLVDCPGIAVCRFFTDQEGRCESCTSCGNLGAFCTLSSECDILFSCFQGRCTNFCTLGTYECGPIEDCLDIGHPTRGVCQP